MTPIRHGFAALSMAALAAVALGGIPSVATAKKAASGNEAGMSASKSIIDNITAAKDFKTLDEAIKAASLVDTLQGPGPFTLFAPTDEAFKKLPPGTVPNLMDAENKPQLVTVLTYHLVPGAFTTKDLAEKIKAGGGKAELKTIQGEKLTVQMKGRAIEVVDGKGNTARVTEANIPQSNGLIDVVDTVLLP